MKEKPEPQIKITGHTNLAEYRKMYGAAYREKNKEYFDQYSKDHKEERNRTARIFQKIHLFDFTSFKEEIKSLEGEIKGLRQKNKELLVKIHDAIEKRIKEKIN